MCRSHPSDTGCGEYRSVSRRSFLGWTAGALALAATPGWIPRVVFADSEDASRDVLVNLFLRGGCDSLSLCVPHGEDAYYALRPSLAVPRPDSGATAAALDLDGFFGFNPAMQPLLEAYGAGDLLVVHATGLTDPTRSHFEAMRFMEVGQPAAPPSLFTGWIGRHLASTAPTLADAALRGVGIGYGLQRSLVGGPLTQPIEDPASFDLAGRPASVDERRQALEEMYRAVGDPLETSAAATFRTIELLDEIDFGSYQPAGGAVYPETELGQALRSTAALIRAEVGVEAVSIDYGGWDTHDEQMPLDGTMAFLMSGLAEALGAFHLDLDASGREDVTTVAMSEFGRNAAENASRGTDHGHGGMMLALGAGIAGGRVLSEWPGLAPGQLYEGQDLAITIDYRDVLSEIVTRRLGNPDVKSVFPDASYTPREWGVTVGSAAAAARG